MEPSVQGYLELRENSLTAVHWANKQQTRQTPTVLSTMCYALVIFAFLCVSRDTLVISLWVYK